MKKEYEYPWTESGLELLIHFKTMINQYGGREILARQIEREVERRPFIKYREIIPKKTIFSPDDDAFIKAHWFDMSLRTMSRQLGFGQLAISRRGRELGFFNKPEVLKDRHGRIYLRQKFD